MTSGTRRLGALVKQADRRACDGEHTACTVDEDSREEVLLVINKCEINDRKLTHKHKV